MIRVLDLREEDDIKKMFEKLGVYDTGIQIMKKKAVHYCVLVEDIPNQAAAILKQDMLSIGGDAAVNGEVISYRQGRHDALLMGTLKEVEFLIGKLELQPYGLKDVADGIKKAIFNFNKDSWDLKIGKYKLLKKPKTLVMGVLNVTPDSFFDGDRYNSLDAAVSRVSEMVEQGADIIDIGGESSRPGAKPVSLEDELERIIPVIKEIRKRFKVPISVDTYKSDVAERAVLEGAVIINDISSLRFDKRMAEVLKKYKVPVVLMHMLGKPLDMQDSPRYKDVVADILKFFRERIEYLRKEGIDEGSVIIDPGIGFGKTPKHNLEILKRIDEFKVFGAPILVGVSRKSVIGKVTGEDVDNRLAGSLAVASYLTAKNISILRVHDVKETKSCVSIMEAING